MADVETLRETALQLGREAINCSTRHRETFWQVSDGEARAGRSGKRLRGGPSQGSAQNLTNAAFERDRLLSLADEAWARSRAAMEALKAADPEVAKTVGQDIARLYDISRGMK